jgi:DNA-directed RNA polymerase specialized sigma24 family protein
MLTNSQKETVVQLQEYLTRIAHNLHNTHWTQVPADDLLSEMNLYIAERAEAEPEFLTQSRGYVTKAAAWHARQWCRDTFTRCHNGQRVSQGLPLETDDDDQRPADEVYAMPQPDSDIAIDVQEALAGLDELTRQIAVLKMQGMARVDIAKAVGKSSQSLSRPLHKIEEALRPVWLVVTGQPEPARQLSLGL